jgi:phospholipase C
MATKKQTSIADPLAGATSPQALLDNLNKIDHIVILIMENRSFDHMLGYLSLIDGRGDVNGLKAGMTNTFRPSAGGPPQTIPIHPMPSTAMATGQDPCHRGGCVDQQISNNMGGFVQNFHDRFPNDPNPGIVMGYYDAAALPVYDFLATEFAISDSWFSSVLGETWPNRLYAVSGKAMGTRDNSPPAALQYKTKAFVRHLDNVGVSWKGYGDSVHYTIRQADDNYRSSDNFEPIFGGFNDSYGFIHDARSGQLPAVALLDPHFFKNDDHPPADVRNGQALVARVYGALAESPNWNKTLFVLVYDEHGGFFDHVLPEPVADDNPAEFGRYGVRVPAFFIGPWVEPGECHHNTFDHTSLIKTILQRFCSQSGPIPNMGKRVAEARHLGEVLIRTAPRAAPAISKAIIDNLAALKAEGFKAAMMSGVPSVPSADELQFIAAVKRTQKDLQLAKIGTRARKKVPRGTKIVTAKRPRVKNTAATAKPKAVKRAPAKTKSAGRKAAKKK